jgi:hypothetical protein
MAVKTFMIGLEWLQVVASSVALAAVSVSICFEELLHDVGDWAFKESGVIVDEVSEAVWIDSSQC